MGEALRECGVLDRADAALLMTADLFPIYELVFTTPDHFLGYLDFRLSVQRRHWVRVADEIELMGLYLAQPSSRWLAAAGWDAVIVTPRYQSDFDELVLNRMRGIDETPARLRHNNTPIIDVFLAELRATRPPGWLAAASAAWRIPWDVQEWVMDQLDRLRRQVSGKDAAVITHPDKLETVVGVSEQTKLGSALNYVRWDTACRESRMGCVVLCGSGGDRIVGIRGWTTGNCGAGSTGLSDTDVHATSPSDRCPLGYSIRGTLTSVHRPRRQGRTWLWPR